MTRYHRVACLGIFTEASYQVLSLTSDAPIIMFDAFHPYVGSLPPVIVLVSAWLGAWLRRQELFGQFSNRQPDAQLRAAKAA